MGYSKRKAFQNFIHTEISHKHNNRVTEHCFINDLIASMRQIQKLPLVRFLFCVKKFLQLHLTHLFNL